MNLRLQRLFARLYRKPLDGEGGDDSGGGLDSLADLAGAVEESDDADGGDPTEPRDDDADTDDDDLSLDDPEDRRPKRNAPDPDDVDGEEGSDPDDTEVSWKDGDTPIKAKMSELRTAYKAKADYEARLPEVTQRETHATQLATHAQTQLAEGVQIVNNILNFMHAQLEANKPPISMLESNPTEYLRMQAMHAEKSQVFNQMVQARNTLGTAADPVQTAAREQRVLAEQSRLYEAKPEWRNPAVRSAELGKIAKALSSVGYSVDEIRGMVDHRALLISHAAYKWQELQALKANKGAPAKKPTKVMKPGVGTTANAPRTNNVEKVAKLRLNRNPDDFNALSALVG